MGNNSKILIAALAGVAAGAVAGLLLAPEKGSKLRKRLAKKGANAKDDVMEKIEEGLTSLQQLKSSILSSVKEAADDVKDKAAKAKHA